MKVEISTSLSARKAAPVLALYSSSFVLNMNEEI